MLLRRLFGGSPSTPTSPSTLLSPLLLILLIAILGALPAKAGDVLETNGFSTCLDGDTITVERMNVKYDRSTSKVTFDVAGTSKSPQYIMARLSVTAYGKNVYTREFNPCDEAEKVEQLCPVPQGAFAAKDELSIPDNLKSMVPDIAFQIPDLDGIAKLELLNNETMTELACLQSVVQNGKTVNLPEVKYFTAAMAGAALLISGVSALGSAAAGAGSGATTSPNFADILFVFQSFACDGMLSVSYPSVYRSFSDNFQWSTGLFSWNGLQNSIDTFRGATGGDLANGQSIQALLNSTLVYDKKNITDAKNVTTSRRDIFTRSLFARQINASINGTTLDGKAANTTSGTSQNTVMRYVEGVQAKVETLQVPSANTFMTVLLIFCIVLAAVAVCILLFKVVLEIWALFASFPKALTGFRKRYWGFLMTTIVRIILILYGTWTLYCLYQFTNGDSWGAHILAGATLAVFTGILGFFIWRIISVAHQAKKMERGQEQLFVHKPYLRKYGLFYDQFKGNFWWVFVPLIIYAFAKGAFIALGDGHGLIQTIGQLSCEVALLILLLWNRPYNTKAGNVLNIIISCVRVLSVVCLIVFVDQLGIAADTKTITGVALIVIQSTLTAVLAICLIVNAIIVMFKENPHTKKRKEMEKLREGDHLTPLDARDSMLAGQHANDGKGHYQPAPAHDNFYFNENTAQGNYPLHHMTPAPEHTTHGRTVSSSSSQGGLVHSATPMGHAREQSLTYEDYSHQGQYQQQMSHYDNPPVGLARGL